jgi:MFS-type transporter involved in bile tolerance (Atg22 family)
MSYRERSGRKPLIPNSIWRKRSFSIICLLVLVSYAVLNGLEYFLSLLLVGPGFPLLLKSNTSIFSFQEVQRQSALTSAIKFFPEVIVGILLNLCTGLLVHRINVRYLVTISSVLTVASPLIIALTNPDWSYWVGGFWAVLTCPFSADGSQVCPQSISSND